MTTHNLQQVTLPNDSVVTNPFPGFWGNELDENAAETRWLWHGYLAAGHITLLTGQWKFGKTTLMSILLSRLKAAGEFCGLPQAQARAVVVSEESSDQWAARQQKLGLSHNYFICRPFASKPDWQQWQHLLDHVADLHRRHNFGLLAMDALVALLPAGAETNADAALKALLPLHRLGDDGMAVLLMHHPRKGHVLPGQAARGSGALSGFADITIEIKRIQAAGPSDRRLRLLGYSRNEVTPRDLIIELNEAGADYTVAAQTIDEDEFMTQWLPLRMVLEDAQNKLDRRQILEVWPVDYPAPCDASLWRYLKRAAELKLICQEGTGRRGDPFRYWLPYVIDQIRENNPCFDVLELINENYRKFLAERDKKFKPQRAEPHKADDFLTADAEHEHPPEPAEE